MVEMIGRPTKMDVRHRITLPAKLIEVLDLKPGDEIYFKRIGDKVCVGKAIVSYRFVEEFLDHNRLKKKK